MTAGSLHVALMRGINVTGKNKLAMRDLAAIFEAAGCADVRTYIQSGNVVYRTGAANAKRVPALVTAAIARDFGYRVPVVARTAAEFAAALTANPFLKRSTDPTTLYVAFLAAVPTPAQAAALDPERSPADRFALVGRDLYVYLPNGVAGSKLTNDYLDRRLGTVSTVRNWNTVGKIAALL
jgi:uncharacterized protein (DUF1697 family)